MARRPGADVGRTQLIQAAQRGGVTLVLGAGVSIARGIPTWPRLVQQLWAETFPARPLPAAQELPQFLPLALELISQERRKLTFAERLRGALYGKLEMPTVEALETSPETLAVLARLLVREHVSTRPRITRVISFNVDDLLEEATWRLRPQGGTVKTVARASHHPERGRGEQAIPVYHLHGFLPQRPDGKWHDAAPDTLVFTDSQYWSTVASPSGFANRVMSFALHDSRCVFIGLSMTDLNILRWLAVRALEISRDKEQQFAGREDEVAENRSTRNALSRHFWIRPDGDDPTGFLSEALQLRGVRSVSLPGWRGDGLATLIDACFPPEPEIARPEEQRPALALDLTPATPLPEAPTAPPELETLAVAPVLDTPAPAANAVKPPRKRGGARNVLVEEAAAQEAGGGLDTQAAMKSSSSPRKTSLRRGVPAPVRGSSTRAARPTK